MKDKQDNLDIPESYNKALELIFTLATGSLALSITFRSDIIGQNKSFLWLLSLAWVLLSITSLSYILIKLIDAGIDTHIVTQKMKYNFTNKLITDMEKDTKELVDRLGNSITEDEKREKMIETYEYSLNELKKLQDEATKTSGNIEAMIKPISSLMKTLFISFLLGILALLTFGVISNIKESLM